MKKYRNGGYGRNPIEEIEIERETATSVWIKVSNGKDRRNSKKTEWHNYFDTWEEAKDFLLKNAERKVERFNVLLSKAEKELASIKALERTSEGVKEDGRS